MFITFEGIEGCGKTTQVKRLVNRLNEIAIPVISTLEPGATKIGLNIRRLLLDSGNQDIAPLTELLLYAADRAQHVREIIKPALEQGNWVICDRFTDSTMVYQGYARGQDMELIEILNEKASQDIRPDLTILLDCPVEIGLARALERNEAFLDDSQDRFEREKKVFHETVKKGYLSQARREYDRFLVIDGTLKEHELEEIIFEHVRPLINI